jgi:hypothetical protein
VAIRRSLLDNAVRTRCSELGLQEPAETAFVPVNLDEARSVDDFVYEASTKTLRKLMREVSFRETSLEPSGSSVSYLHQKAADWIAPTLFVAASFLQQNPMILSIYVNILSSYIYDLFKGGIRSGKVKARILIEQKPGKKLQLIEYEGDYRGIKELAKVVKELKK